MTENCDVCVVGGGPSGMMAAGRAAECGASVVLLEKNRTTGKKLLITGGGRCNVTNAETDRHRLVARYGRNSQALHSPLSRFSPQEMRAFLERSGVETKVENEGRVFPTTNKSRTIHTALLRYMAEGGVRVVTGSPVDSILVGETGVAIHCAGQDQEAAVYAGACIVATGGTSRPETGSTGDGFRWLEEMGHSIRVPEPSLVPIQIQDRWPAALQGLALPDAKIVVLLDGARQFDGTGKLLFTHFGISGPLVLNLSQRINEVAQGGPVDLMLDLFPSEDGGAVERTVLDLLSSASNRKLHNALGSLVPSRMVAVLLDQSGVDGEIPCHSLSRTDRRLLVSLLKALPMRFAGLLGTDHAVVSSGGVSPDEIDFRTMQSKRRERLFVVGDLLDFDRQSGGYSLQLCWSTGYVAGEAAATLWAGQVNQS
jgi:predicted Rossmann fold flavoprotein